LTYNIKHNIIITAIASKQRYSKNVMCLLPMGYCVTWAAK